MGDKNKTKHQRDGWQWEACSPCCSDLQLLGVGVGVLSVDQRQEGDVLLTRTGRGTDETKGREPAIPSPWPRVCSFPPSLP